MEYTVEDFDKCDFCQNKYIGITFMNMRFCHEHEYKAEKISDDACDYYAEVNACNE